MKRAAVFAVSVSMAAVLVAAGHVAAQTTPDLSGSWTLVADPNAPARGGGGAARGGGGGGRGGGGARGGGGGGFGAGLGMAPTITQSATQLTVVSSTPAGETRRVFNLDGSQSSNTLTLGGNQVQQVSTARWDAGKLVITTSQDFGGNTTQTTMTLSLDGSGALVVETQAPGRGGGAPTPITQRYTKGE